jgi:hypothetical protein
MASDVTIANLALLKLGKQRIAAFDEPNLVSGLFAEFYAPLRDQLQRLGWNFTKKFTTLSPDVDPPPFGYSFQFQVPDDFLGLRVAGPAFPPGDLPVPMGSSPTPPAPPVMGAPGVNLSDYNNAVYRDYEVAGRKIYANIHSPLCIIYSARVTDPNRFDSYFVAAFSWYLAMELCEMITGSNAKFPRMEKGFEDSLKMARKWDALENAPATIPDDTFMLARIGS